MTARVSLTVPPGEQADEAHTPGLRVEASSWRELPPTLPAGAGERPLHVERLTPEGGLSGCLACGHPELYRQKDFPRGLGIAIVVVAAVLAPFFWYLPLLLAFLLDSAIYLVRPDVVVCYVCRAQHRGFGALPRHPRFDREIEERLRYGTRAVMGKPMREGGTADAPEPEH